MKCFAAFTILAAVLGLLIWFMIQAPQILACIAISCLVTWAIYTALRCLEDRGIL
jgi:hypothetical protein